jgi:1,4-alpha-glucan branching enzyme
MKIRKPQTFHFSAPTAHSVMLVGDFTDWQRRPIAMYKRNGGAWTITVDLVPGEHHYRFMVDGEWRDDPECTTRVPNPYGSQDMVTNIP